VLVVVEHEVSLAEHINGAYFCCVSLELKFCDKITRTRMERSKFLKKEEAVLMSLRGVFNFVTGVFQFLSP
jgi:hypothetical protein